MAHHHHHHRGAHAHPPAGSQSPRSRLRYRLRLATAIALVLVLALAACLIVVQPGQAVVVTRVGNPIKVLLAPGLALKLPPPIDNTIDVDLRLRTTSSGLQDVGTRDGLRVLVQAYVAWRVPSDDSHVRQFLRAVRNQPDAAAAQLRSFIGSSLEVTASSFDLSSLVNTDPRKIQLAAFENRLQRSIADQALKVYGITVEQVGIERLTLSSETLDATIERMKAERDTAAAQRSAEGARQAAQITADADRDSRITVADARAGAAGIEAKARERSAQIYQAAYAKDPTLYTMLRSFDTLDAVLNKHTQLILRTDAAPFRVLVNNPADQPLKAPPRQDAKP